jgi:hypothetical protein
VLIEAILVASVLILALVGSVYVSHIYHSALRAKAVSRAAAIGYSMEACKGGDPQSWFNEQELAMLTNSDTEETNAGANVGASGVKDEKARRALTQAARSGDFGSPRVMSTTTGGEVFGPLLDPKRIGGIFYTKVKANDLVLCGEIPHRHGTLGVLGFARDFFKF